MSAPEGSIEVGPAGREPADLIGIRGGQDSDAFPPAAGGPAVGLIVERLKCLVSSEPTEAVMQEIRSLLSARIEDIGGDTEDDPIAPLRANLWSVLLLGLRSEDLNSRHKLVSSSLHGRTTEADHAQGLMHFPKEDQRVLAADIKRTRQAYAMFKRDDVMQVVSHVLERYCVGHGIRYKQGQNELIAPFIILQDPPLPLPVLGLLFESFMSRYVSRWFVDDEIEALLVSYRVFRVLLFYVDPGLANKLDDADFVPELYATAWLITLFSRNLSLELVMRLWDVYLAVNDPALVFFLLAALLVRNRDTILKVDQAHMMPETVQGLNIEDKQDLEELIVQAREMLRKIPGSFLRTVRSCCSDHGNTPLDTSRSLFCEFVRCASIEPGELLERMTARSAQDQDLGDEGQRAEGGKEGNRSPCPMRPGPVDTIALDIRPLEEFENSGVGHLGKSVRLDPCLLDMDEVLEKWMQHFDGARGTHVCLVDSIEPAPRRKGGGGREGGASGNAAQNASLAGNPSSAAFGNSRNGGAKARGGSHPGNVRGNVRGNGKGARERSSSCSSSPPPPATAPSLIEDPLWRRLLFGDGEGASPDEDEWVEVSHRDSGGGKGVGGRGSGGVSRGAGGGAGAAEGEKEGFGAAKAFAEKLHARGFPYVSILEGGMEGIVDHLHTRGSPLEPTVINHDPEAYQAWRRAQSLREQQNNQSGQQRTAISRAGEAFSWRGKGLGSPSVALQGEYSAPSDDGRGRLSSEAGAGGRDNQKVGVLDRLGLMRVRDGVTQGVGTVARTGAWAVRGGAGLIIPPSRSGEATTTTPDASISSGTAIQGGGGGVRGGGLEGTVPMDEAKHPDGLHARADSGNIWEADDLLVDEDGRDMSAIFGAIRSAQAAVSRGVGSVRRPNPSQTPPGSADAAPSGDGRRAGLGAIGFGVDGNSRAEGKGQGEAEAVGGKDSDTDMLLMALKTAEENGHAAVAKALRARLGFMQGQALRAQLSQDGKAQTADPERATAMLESLADL